MCNKSWLELENWDEHGTLPTIFKKKQMIINKYTQEKREKKNKKNTTNNTHNHVSLSGPKHMVIHVEMDTWF